MALLRYRAFRTRGVYASWPAFRREVARAYQQELFPLVRAYADNKSSEWKYPPKWDQSITIEKSGIRHYIYPYGRGAFIWGVLDRGVAGRHITVKKTWTASGKGKYKPTLKLQRYSPGTSGFGVAGTGFRFGPVGYRRSVWWPGISPRYLSAQVAREVARPYIRISENAVRRGIRAAQREGR